jgi:ribosomal protein L33
MVFLSINNVLIGLVVILVILIIWIILIQVKLSRLFKRNEEIFSGTDSKNLEEALRFYTREIKKNRSDSREIQKFCKHLNKIAERSIQKVGSVRFNPFADTGGNQSFVVSFLDYHNNGIVISSLHGREGTRIYAKPVLGGKSKYNLSTEEIKAIDKAINTKREIEEK